MKIFLSLILFLSTFSLADTKLIILGSGTPNPDPNRSGSSYAILVNETAYLVDFGPGAVRQAAALSESWGGPFKALNVENLEHAFLTHIHSDHSIGLADLLLTPWVMGRNKKLKLFGPKALKEMAESISNAYRKDIDYRINGTQPTNNVGYKVDFKELIEGEVFKDSNLVVDAFLVNHGELEDSYGFRFRTKDKTIIFSGDTSPSKKVEEYAHKADILVHEVYSQSGFLKKTNDWQIYHKGHHTSSLEVAELAKKAKPKKLVLSHILFWGTTPEKLFQEVSNNYEGEVILAKDLMIIN